MAKGRNPRKEKKKQKSKKTKDSKSKKKNQFIITFQLLKLIKNKFNEYLTFTFISNKFKQIIVFNYFYYFF